MGKACGMYGEEHLDRPRHRRKKLLNRILKKQDVRVNTALIWLGTGTSSRLLRTWQCTFGIHKT